MRRTKCSNKKPSTHRVGEFFSLSKFNKNDRWCRECRKIHNKEWRVKHPNYNKEYYEKHSVNYNNEEYRKKHSKKIKTNRERFYAKHPSYDKEYREKHPEKIAAYGERVYKKDLKKTEARRERFCKKHPGYGNEWAKDKYKTDPNFRMLRILRGRFDNALNGTAKAATTLELLGCSTDYVWIYLEDCFTDGMTKKKVMNGEIHIDHIRPCSSFDLTDPEQQKKCFHYTNMQPLWAKDNLRKGAK